MSETHAGLATCCPILTGERVEKIQPYTKFMLNCVNNCLFQIMFQYFLSFVMHHKCVVPHLVFFFFLCCCNYYFVSVSVKSGQNLAQPKRLKIELTLLLCNIMNILLHKFYVHTKITVILAVSL